MLVFQCLGLRGLGLFLFCQKSPYLTCTCLTKIYSKGLTFAGNLIYLAPKKIVLKPLYSAQNTTFSKITLSYPRKWCPTNLSVVEVGMIRRLQIYFLTIDFSYISSLLFLSLSSSNDLSFNHKFTTIMPTCSKLSLVSKHAMRET